MQFFYAIANSAIWRCYSSQFGFGNVDLRSGIIKTVVSRRNEGSVPAVAPAGFTTTLSSGEQMLLRSYCIGQLIPFVASRLLLTL